MIAMWEVYALMEPEHACPGCRGALDIISASGRADDLFICPDCYNSWFAFELDHEQPHPVDADEPDSFN